MGVGWDVFFISSHVSKKNPESFKASRVTPATKRNPWNSEKQTDG